jgi:hypothetical protein
MLPSATPPPSERSTLLAVDLGLRAGVALYDSRGRLLSYRSTNFGSMNRLKRGISGIIKPLDTLAWVVVEGDRRMGEMWEGAALHRGAGFDWVSPEQWRSTLLIPRKRRSGVKAKAEAEVLARKVIRWSELKGPTSLRHDAAEAILIGLWAVLTLGWLNHNPL